MGGVVVVKHEANFVGEVDALGRELLPCLGVNRDCDRVPVASVLGEEGDAEGAVVQAVGVFVALGVRPVVDDVAGFFAFAGFGGEAVPTVVGFGGLQVVGSGELGKLEGDVLVLALDRAERGGVQVGEERSGGGGRRCGLRWLRRS